MQSLVKVLLYTEVKREMSHRKVEKVYSKCHNTGLIFNTKS